MFAMTFNVAEKKNHDSYVLYLETKYSKFLPIILSTISILLLPSLDRSRESVKSTRSYRININRLFFLSPRWYTRCSYIRCIFINRLSNPSITNAAREISFRKASSFLCSCVRSRVMAGRPDRGHRDSLLPIDYDTRSSSILHHQILITSLYVYIYIYFTIGEIFRKIGYREIPFSRYI